MPPESREGDFKVGGGGVRRSDILMAVFVACIWGFGFTVAKAALAGFPPIFLMALRFTVTAAALVWFVRPPTGYMVRVLMISIVGAGVQYSVTFTGLKGLDVSAAIIIIQLEPAYASLLAAIFLKDMIGWRRAIGMALAFAGVLILVGEPTIQGAYLSAGMVALGSLLFAAGQVMTKALKGAVGGFQLTAWIAVFAVPQLFLATALFEDSHWTHLRDAGTVVWIAILYLGLIMTALGYGLWYRLINKYSINLVMPFTLLLPFATVLSAIVLLGERPRPIVLLGGAVTIIGVAVIIVRENPFARKARAGGS